MDSSSPLTTIANTSAIEDLNLDILHSILHRLDATTLAATSCASTHLRSLAADPDMWRRLCLSTWPSLSHPRLFDLIITTSFSNSHRSFFSDSYPFPRPASSAATTPIPIPSELISAVDLHLKHEGHLLFSRVIETETTTPWFLSSPFRVDALDYKEPPPPAQSPTSSMVISAEDLHLSWIVIDPETRRSVNLSSRRPVSIERHWYTGETKVRFATVLGRDGGVAAVATVTCGEEMVQVREVSLIVEDMEGACLNGRESLAVLRGALEGRRQGKGGMAEEVAKERYSEFERTKAERKEKRRRREGWLDACYMAFAMSLFLGSVWFAVATRKSCAGLS